MPKGAESLTVQMQGTSFSELIAYATEQAPKICGSFPHLICNETRGLHFDNWCEPCQANAVLKTFARTEED